jgi:hypothetical protein
MRATEPWISFPMRGGGPREVKPMRGGGRGAASHRTEAVAVVGAGASERTISVAIELRDSAKPGDVVTFHTAAEGDRPLYTATLNATQRGLRRVRVAVPVASSFEGDDMEIFDVRINGSTIPAQLDQTPIFEAMDDDVLLDGVMALLPPTDRAAVGRTNRRLADLIQVHVLAPLRASTQAQLEKKLGPMAELVSVEHADWPDAGITLAEARCLAHCCLPGGALQHVLTIRLSVEAVALPIAELLGRPLPSSAVASPTVVRDQHDATVVRALRLSSSGVSDREIAMLACLACSGHLRDLEQLELDHNPGLTDAVRAALPELAVRGGHKTATWRQCGRSRRSARPSLMLCHVTSLMLCHVARKL